MKIYRLLAALLFVSSLSIVAPAQESSELASLRTKAEKGNGIAQYNLGLAYAEGRGTAADPLEAFVWLSLARENGARGRALDNLVASFDRATFEAAQKRLAARKGGAVTKTTVTPVTRPEPSGPTSPAAPSTPGEEKAAPAAPREDPALARMRGERDALSVKFTELSAELAALRAEREHLAAQAAENAQAAQAARETSGALQEQNRAAEARVAGLVRESGTVKAELERAKQSLAALEQAPKPAPDTAALDQRTRELQAVQTELETSRNFGREVEATLNKVTDQKTALEAQLAAKSTAPAYPDLSARVRELEAQASADLAAIASAKAEAGRARQEAVAFTKARDDAQTGATNAAQEAAALKTQLAGLTAETEKARQEAADLRVAQTELNTRVTAAGSASAATIASLQEKLAAASAETSHAREETAALAQARTAAEQQLAEFGSLKSTLEQNRSQLAASEQRAAALNSRVAELEQQAARLADSRSAGEAAQKRVTEVTAELTALQSEVAQLRQKPAAPIYPDLSGRVRELEAQVAAGSSAMAAAQADTTRTKQELAAVVQAKEEAQRQLAAQPAPPAYPDLSGKVSELESKLAALATIADNAKQQVATLTQAKEAAEKLAAEKPTAPAYPDLSGRVHELEAQVTAASTEHSALQSELTQLREKAAKPAYPDLTGKVQELETQVGSLQAALAAKPAVPAYPDLSGRVSELESQLGALRDASGNSAKAADALKAQLQERDSQLQAAQNDIHGLGQKLKQADVVLGQAQESFTAMQAEAERLRQRSAAPAHPDLAGKVAELESKLAAAEKLAAEKPAAPAYPDLSGRVRELEAQVTTTNEAAKAEAGRAQQEVAALTKARTDAEQHAAELQSGLAALTTAASNTKQEVAALTKAKEDVQAQVGTLTAERDAARTAQNELGGALTKFEQEKNKLAAAQSSTAETARQITELGEKAAAAEKQAAALRQERDAVSGKMTDLVGNLSTLQADRERMQKLLADAGHQMRDATAAANRIKELETQIKDHTAETEAVRTTQTELHDTVAKLEQEKTQLTAALQSAHQAAPTYPDLSSKVTELETQVGSLQSALAAKPAYPDLSGHVQELEGTIATLTQKIGATEQARADLAKQFDDYKSSTLAAQRESTKQQAELKMLESDKAALRRQVDTVTAEAAQWRTQASALKAQAAATPAYPDLSGKVTELEAKLAAAEKLASEKPVAPIYPDLSGRVSELEAKLAALAAEAGNAKQQVATLTQAKEAAEKTAAEKPAAPAYPDLSGRVRELETAVADSARQLTAAGTTQAELQRKLDGTTTALQKALKDQNNDESVQLRRERDELSGRLATLTGEVAQLRIDRERMQKMLADAGKQMRDATADANRIKELETQATSLQGALNAAQAQVGSLAAKPAAPAYPDLSGRVQELEAQVASGSSALVSAKAEADKAKQQVATLTQAQEATAKAVTEQPAARPSYPDLSGKVAELESKLAAAEKLAAEKPPATTYPDLPGRVSELEAALADTKRQLVVEQAKPAPAAAAAIPGVNIAELRKQLAETEDKLAISLRGYAVLQKERDALQGGAGQSNEILLTEKNSLAAQVASLTSEVTRLKSAAPAEVPAPAAAPANQALAAERDSLATRVATLTDEVARLKSGATAQAEAQNQAAALANERNNLSVRLAAVEASVASAQAEAARANQALAALQRSSAQSTTELAATRTLVQQLQGSNTVLAGENYQLKTMLARAAGTPAPVVAAPVVAAPTAPGPRTHVVASGDSLSRISQRYYGTANRWQEIYNANRDRINNEGVLRVGTELRIP